VGVERGREARRGCRGRRLTSIQILFPSSYPKTQSQLDSTREALRPYEQRLSFIWPREIRARRLEDPSDYQAGPDEVRCQELVTFLESDCSVAWFGRGGYGLTRILPQLAHALSRMSLSGSKRFMGYSDISALFAVCKALSLPIECIHGPMACAFAHQPNKNILLDALAGEPSPIPFTANREELEFHGSIWGGNLAVLASLAGTPWLPTPGADCAVFLEDVDEAPYRVDRYFTQLHQSGFFSLARKVILGTFTGFEPASAVYDVAVGRCQELGLDFLGRVPIGHSEPHSPLFLDRPYRYSPSERHLLPNFRT
jgi:muramoyltetrapeptide carboxypeptidase